MIPKPFVKVWRREVILWLLESLTFQSTDALVFVFNDKLELGLSTRTSFTVFYRRMFRYPTDELETTSEVYLFDQTDRGSAKTVLREAETFSPERLMLSSVLLDGDTFHNVDVLTTLFRTTLRASEVTNLIYSSGDAVVVFDDDIPDDSPYSYVLIDNLNMV